jgi:hypothetical protein
MIKIVLVAFELCSMVDPTSVYLKTAMSRESLGLVLYAIQLFACPSSEALWCVSLPNPRPGVSALSSFFKPCSTPWPRVLQCRCDITLC